MKNIYVMILFLTGLCSFSQTSTSADEVRLILKFKNPVSFEKGSRDNPFKIKKLKALHAKNPIQSATTSGNKKVGDTYVVQLKSNQNIDLLIKDYERTGLFEYVEPDFIGEAGGKKMLLQRIPDDTYFSRQYGLVNDGTFSLSPAKPDADIDMDLAWDIETGDASIIVAVLDSGVKLDHPELINRIWVNPNESADNSDNDANGYTDDLNGWDFVNNDNDPTDDHGHGTNVTGIIGADARNNLGYAGVDWNCRLMICKVLNDKNSGYYSWWAEAIYYAVDNGAKVINMSLGGSSYSNALKDAVEYAHDKGAVVVASMMNKNTDDLYYPVAYPSTIAVGSTNPNDERSAPFSWSEISGSNYGNHIDVVAPGNYIYGLNKSSNTNFNSYWSGTSQAAPLVAGLSALLLAQDPTRTPDDIRAIIRATAEDQVGDPAEDITGFDPYYGYGRINAEHALLQNSLSLDENRAQSPDLFIYPNPFSDRISIKNRPVFKCVVIYNLLGVEMRRNTTSGEDFLTMNLSGLSSGFYIAAVLDAGGHVLYSKKLLKQ